MRYDFSVAPAPPIRAPAWRTTLSGICCMLLVALLPTLCAAHQLSKLECSEGGDFIKNAALSRDGGMNEARFLDQIRSDIEVIKGLPRELRWFVQDDEDADFLLTAATEVFRNPKDARTHQADFLLACDAKRGRAAVYF